MTLIPGLGKSPGGGNGKPLQYSCLESPIAEELMLLNCGIGEDSWSPLDCKEIQPVHPKGDQSWVFIGRTDVEAETPILWPPDAKN